MSAAFFLTHIISLFFTNCQCIPPVWKPFRNSSAQDFTFTAKTMKTCRFLSLYLAHHYNFLRRCLRRNASGSSRIINQQRPVSKAAGERLPVQSAYHRISAYINLQRIIPCNQITVEIIQSNLLISSKNRNHHSIILRWKNKRHRKRTVIKCRDPHPPPKHPAVYHMGFRRKKEIYHPVIGAKRNHLITAVIS